MARNWEYLTLQDNPEYREWADENNLDPWAEDTEVQWKDEQEDRYTNPHG